MNDDKLISENLKPCECGIDINKSFRIQELWNGFGRMVVGVAYCDNCNAAVSFHGEFMSLADVAKAAYKAWNTRADDMVSRKEVIEAVKGTFAASLCAGEFKDRAIKAINNIGREK